jgi:hypothetical protein
MIVREVRVREVEIRVRVEVRERGRGKRRVSGMGRVERRGKGGRE